MKAMPRLNPVSTALGTDELMTRRMLFLETSPQRCDQFLERIDRIERIFWKL